MIRWMGGTSGQAATGSAHPLRRMAGRDPDEPGRAATPLELLFDLTFVVAVGLAANLFAHRVAEGHVGAGLLAFGFATFAVCWAWVNFAWFASAFDTDDWVYRVVTMVQMVGVCILALGLPALFASLDQGAHVDNRVMVLGYVVMRLAMVFQWLRAARQSPDRRRACHTYATAITVAQVGWVALAVLDLPLLPTFLVVILLDVVEFAGPWVAERTNGGTPWHAHHIAERYSLFAIIALGEGVVGTVAVLASAQETTHAITADVVLVGTAGIGLTFGMWWTYFLAPAGRVLHVHRDRSFGWGYGHIALFGAIIATGAGLHVAALTIEGESHLDAPATVLAVGIPVALYLTSRLALAARLARSVRRSELAVLLGSLLVLGAAVLLARAGVSMAGCLIVVMLAPAVTVVGHERIAAGR